MDYREELERVLTMLYVDIQNVNKSKHRLGKRRLMISASGKRLLFFEASGSGKARKLKSIGANQEYDYQLAHKAYNNELLKCLNYNASKLEALLRELKPTDFDSMLPLLPKNYNILNGARVTDPTRFLYAHDYPNPSGLVAPSELVTSIGSEDPWEWAAKEYCENTDHPEHKVHRTRDGLLCRSKSEAIIYDIYKSLEIPFHYDEVLKAGGQSLSPDFYGVRRDGALIAHEHKGLFTEEYFSRSDWKDGLYAVSGFRQGDNLLYTFDSPTGKLNVNLIEAQIREIYWI